MCYTAAGAHAKGVGAVEQDCLGCLDLRCGRLIRIPVAYPSYRHYQYTLNKLCWLGRAKSGDA